MYLLLWVVASCSALAAWCGATVSPDTLDFGSLPLGRVQSRSLTLTNGGSGELVLLRADIRQWAWGGFAIATTVPQTLQPGESLSLEVRALFVHNLPCQGILLLRLRCEEAEWTYPCLLQAHPQDPDSVYALTDGLWGEALRQRLQELVQQQRVLPYDSARRAIFFDVDNRGGKVECVYTGQTIAVPPMPSPTVFNVEHTWPRSRGSDTLPPLSDLHHLFPTRAEANEQRRDLRFGLVRTVLWQLGGSRYGLDSTGAEVFEPRDRHKGDAARALFYVALRYGNMTGWLTAPYEALLRRWHEQDTVDEWERERTHRIARLQGRANPFVERPQLLERLSRVGGTAAFPDIAQPVLSDTVLEYRGREPSAEVRLGILNLGWGAAQLRALDILELPAGVEITPRLLDSLIAPGRTGWVVVRLQGIAGSSGNVRMRLRFAAGVRPLEVVLRLTPSGIASPWAIRLVEGDELVVHWAGPVPADIPRLTVFTVAGQALACPARFRALADGSVEVRLPRDRLPRGLLLLRVNVGQQVWWTWRLNP